MLGTGMTFAGGFGAWLLADRVPPGGNDRAWATVARIMAMIAIGLFVFGRIFPTPLN